MLKLRSIHSTAFAVLLLVPTILAETRFLAAQSTPAAVPAGKSSSVIFSLMLLGTEQAPVKLVKILLDDQPVALETPITVSGNWVGRLKLVVQNVSPKTVVAGTTALIYIETGTGKPDQPTLSTPILVGRVPPVAFRRKDGTLGPFPEVYAAHPEIRIAPGETMLFQVSQPQAESDPQEAYRIAGKIGRVGIQFHSFYFEDGTKWTGAYFLTPVDSPLLWRQTSVDEFFGRKSVDRQ